MRLCTVQDCGRRHQGRGYCKAHYNRYYKAHRGVTVALGGLSRYETITDLAGLGCTVFDIARRLKIKPESVQRTLERAGDHDLRARLARAS